MSFRWCECGSVDLLDPGIGRVPGGGEVRPDADDGEHAPAGGHEALAVGVGPARRPGVQDVDTGQRLRVLDARDRVARADGPGVAAGRDHHGHRGGVEPLQRRQRTEGAGGRRVQDARERGAQPRQHDLGLGVAEAGVELHDAQPLARHGQTHVEHARERRAATGHLCDRRPGHAVHDLLDEVLRRPRQRRVRAHAAGVRSLVAVAHPLEVLRGDERHGVDAVGQDEQRDLRAVQVVLDDDPAAGLRQAVGGVRERLVAVVGDDDALARGETVVLDDVRRAERVQAGCGLLQGRRDARLGGRDARGGHDLLGERLGTLELSCRGRRSEDGDAGGAHRVGDAGHERGLGPDDDEVRAQPTRELRDRSPVELVDRVQPREQADAGVAGCCVQLGHRGVEGERADERVLTGTGADDEDLHGG